jgi:diguanylate cyclase (GGDEF)-like protein
VHARIGVDPLRPPPEAAFCDPGLPGDEVLVVQDATQDARFRDHPMVVGLPEIRFYVGCPVKGPDGRSLGTLSVVDHEPREVELEDVRMLEDLARMLEQDLRSLSLAMKDELTGLTNRRGFDQMAEQTIAMCRRVGEPATLLYFDLDDFKGINDTLGHAAGDRVLRTFSERLSATFRDSDVVARIGGDEFCVLLTGATAQDVERPLSLLEGRLRTREGEPIVAFRVGVAAYDPERHKSVRALVHDADLLMYEQKRNKGPQPEARH